MHLDTSKPIQVAENLMRVSIPARDDHEGCWKVTLLISNRCPKCGTLRGKPYDGISYDGSRRLHCHQWTNPCGHVDYYSEVRKEAQKNGFNK